MRNARCTIRMAARWLFDQTARPATVNCNGEALCSSTGQAIDNKRPEVANASAGRWSKSQSFDFS